jgi:hypothetical protein
LSQINSLFSGILNNGVNFYLLHGQLFKRCFARGTSKDNPCNFSSKLQE